MALGAFEGWPEDRGLFRELGTGARIEVVAVGAKSPSSALGTFWSLVESGMQGLQAWLVSPSSPSSKSKRIDLLPLHLDCPVALWVLTVGMKL